MILTALSSLWSLPQIDIHQDEMKKLFRGWTYKENYKILSREVRNLGENIPPLSMHIWIITDMRPSGHL